MPLDPIPRAVRALALACALALTACSHPAADAPAAVDTTPSNVRLSDAQLRHITIRTLATTPIRSTVTSVGVVDFDNDRATSVVAPFSGPVLRVLVQPGQKVHRGDPLAVVDSADYAAAVDALVKAQATAKNLDTIARSDADLLVHQGVSARENRQAQADAAGADADLDAARRALLALGADPTTLAQTGATAHAGHGQAILRAPIAGTVAEKLIAPGTLLQAGSTACFTLADLSRAWVMAQLSPSDLKHVALGDPVDVFAPDDGKPLAGTLDNLSAVVDPDTRAVTGRVVVDNPGDALKKQMYVRVAIHSKTTQEGILVPDSAILRDDENLPFVFVRLADGRFARRHVRLGVRDGKAYAITEGLHAGERIVVDGGLFMQFMQSQ